MKVVFAGTPDFAVAPLQKIIDSRHEVVGVITQTDKPQGRKGILTPPPVKVLAEKYALPLLQPERIKNEAEGMRALGGEVLITCAYGQILTQEILDVFPKGVWNIHAGLLPAYRGASPIQSCILAGERETGVSVMKTELGLDCGDILLVEKTPIGEYESYGELSERLSKLGSELILTALDRLESGEYTLVPQGSEGVGVVRKIHKEQAKVCFSWTAREIVNVVRAMNPAPVAYAVLGENKLNIYRAEEAGIDPADWERYQEAREGEVLFDKPKKGLVVKCLGGAVKLVEAQTAGGKRMAGSDLINGRRVVKGDILQ